MKGLIFIAFLLLPTLSKACLCNGVTPATCATAPCTIQCGLCRSRCCAIPFIGREETGKDGFISNHVYCLSNKLSIITQVLCTLKLVHLMCFYSIFIQFSCTKVQYTYLCLIHQGWPKNKWISEQKWWLQNVLVVDLKIKELSFSNTKPRPAGARGVYGAIRFLQIS